ncbi:MAG: SDR family oxidoreductase [Pseudomonadota bacterium]
MKDLDSKVLVICGSATGIGAATVRRLHAEGARVVAADINLEGVQGLVESLGDERALALWYDQADESSIQAMIEAATQHFGQLDGLLANAANLTVILEDGDLLDNDARIWKETLDVNVIGVANLFKAALPHLQDKGGVLLATSSDAASMGEPTRVAYAASKAAINAIVRHVAKRWGKDNIRANVVSPGLIMTEQLVAAFDEATSEAMLTHTPSPRHGTPEDIAAAVAYLFSSDADWINGQVWHVNGGIFLSN